MVEQNPGGRTDKQKAELIRTFKSQTDFLKDQGRSLFQQRHFVPAIQTYQKGFVLCNEYFEAMNRELPMKMDFRGVEDAGNVEETKEEHVMWLQDFELLKATFCNNMSASYCNMGDVQNADVYNNWALKECPDYAKALHRKCLIMEMKGEYSQAVKMADWCSERFSHEDEPESNQ